MISRNSLGCNDNPDAVQLASAFKKLLVCHPLLTSLGSNNLTNATGILTISSNKNIQPKPPVVEIQEIELELDYEVVMLAELEAAEPYEQHLWAYIALCVEEKFVENTKNHIYKCNECAGILLSENDKINDEFLAMKDRVVGKIQQPSASTLKIIIFCNAVIKMHSEEYQSSNSIKVIKKNISSNIDIGDLFNDDDFTHRNHEESAQRHKKEFIELIVETHMKLKSYRICKKITDEERGELIRHRKKREVIVRGQ